MTDAPSNDQERREHARRKIRLSELEADVAYFEARLEIIGEPQTANQIAQHRTFKLLQQGVGNIILQTRHGLIDDG